VIFLCKIEIQGQFVFTIFWLDYFFLLKTSFLNFEIARRQKIKKFSTRTKISKTLIVAVGTIRMGTIHLFAYMNKIIFNTIFFLALTIKRIILKWWRQLESSIYRECMLLNHLISKFLFKQKDEGDLIVEHREIARVLWWLIWFLAESSKWKWLCCSHERTKLCV